MGTGSLAVRVWDDDGHRPVAGATVTIWTESREPRTGTTDAAGQCDFGDLPDGWVGAVVHAPGFAPSDPDFATIAGGLVATLRFELERGVGVEGVVVARDGGAPVAGTRVAAIRDRSLHDDGPPFDVTLTDADGRFRIAAVPRKTESVLDGAVLCLTCDGFASVDVVARPAAADPGPLRLHVEMPPGAMLRGTVRDADGRPVGGARVAAHRGEVPESFIGPGRGFGRSGSPSGAVTVRRPWTCTSQADGTFALSGLEADRTYTLVAHAGGFTHSSPVAVNPGPTAEPIDLQLRRRGGLTVRVVDGAGKPLPDATVAIPGTEESLEPEPCGDGVWKFPAIAAATAYVHVDAPGHVSTMRTPSIRPGRSSSLRVALKPSFHLAGTVVDDTGAPVAGARVWAESDRFVDEQAGFDGAPIADSDGRFRLDDLPAVKHRVMLSSPSHERTVRRGFRPPLDDVRLVLPRAVTVRARFTVPPGSDLPREVAVAHAPLPRHGRPPHVSTDAWRGAEFGIDDGVTEILGVPSGRAILLVHVAGFQRIERRVAAVHGETVDLGTVALVPALALDGRVVHHDGRPLAGSTVSVEQPRAFDGGAWSIRATTAADGTFRLHGLWRGPVEVTVGVDWFDLEEFDVDIGVGEPVTLTLPRDRPVDPLAEVHRRLDWI